MELGLIQTVGSGSVDECHSATYSTLHLLDGFELLRSPFIGQRPLAKADWRNQKTSEPPGAGRRPVDETKRGLRLTQLLLFCVLRPTISC